MSSLRASATIIVLRVPARRSAVRALYHRASALSFLKPQKAPGEWDHPAADPGIAGFGEPLFAPLGAALVRRTRQAGVARHRSAVTHGPRQHLIDEHIGRFSADADNPNQQSNHGVRPAFSLPPQSLSPRLLPVLDPADHQPESRDFPPPFGWDMRRQRRAFRR